MDNFPILCTICDQTLKGDQAYLQHMQSEHGTTSTSKALAKDKAIKQNVPRSVPIGKDIPPTDEFMEVAKQIDLKPPIVRSEVSTSPPVHSSGTQQQEVKPLELKYKWEGDCPKCNGEITTLEVPIEDNLIAIAYCIRDRKQVEYKKVIPLNKYDIAKKTNTLEQREKGFTKTNRGTEEAKKYTNEIKVEKRHRKRKTKNASTLLQKKDNKNEKTDVPIQTI